jgi:hypothetical protein
MYLRYFHAIYSVITALPPRIEYPVAFYHVILRGNQRQGSTMALPFLF